MTESITEAARREAEARFTTAGSLLAVMCAAFVEGAEFGAARERDREPSDAEVEAGAFTRDVHDDIAGSSYCICGRRFEHLSDQLDHEAREVLAAARAARKEAEG